MGKWVARHRRVAVLAVLVWMVAPAGGAVAGWWDVWAGLDVVRHATVALVAVGAVMMWARAEAAGSAYRRGIGAGRRIQRDRCRAHGHVCAEDVSGELRSMAAAGGGHSGPNVHPIR